MKTSNRLTQDPPAAPDNTISIIARGASFVGQCRTENAFRIEGRVEGKMESRGAVSVGEEGVVVGDITANDVVVGGRIEGRMAVASRVRLKASCAVDGEIDTERMQIEDGAVVNATVRMGTGRSPSPPRQPQKPGSVAPAPKRRPLRRR